jgi:hypothetical protein
MKYIICFLIFFTSNKEAFSKNPLIYFFGNLSVVFDKVDNVIVNKSCLNKKCKAYKNYQKFKDHPLDQKWLLGGKNPRAVRCTKVMGGEVHIGVDILGNQQSVCKFDDNSYLI